MSRINRQKNKTISDGTEDKTIYNKGVSRKIHKKVGHKGDYAIVNFKSPFISSVKTGGGTSEDPYIYMLDVEDSLVDSITNNKSKLLEQIEESKGINGQVNLVEKQRLDMLTGFTDMFSFNVDLLKLSLKVTDIGNSKEKNIGVSKYIHPQKVKRNKVNNLFYVGGDFKLPLKHSIRYNLNIKSKDNIDSNAPTPCESGYKVHINKGVDSSSFSFYITYNNLPITYDYLEEKIETKMIGASIDFLIEYK